VAVWTTTDFLADVRRSGSLGSASIAGVTDTDILAVGDKETQTALLPFLAKLGEDFFMRSLDVALVSGQSQYRVPKRAIGARLRHVSLVRNGVSIANLNRIAVEDLETLNPYASSVPTGFYVDAGGLTLVPAPGSSGDLLRLRYLARPGRLVAVAACRQLTGVFRDTPTVGQTRITWGGLTLGNTGTFDLIAGNTPHEHLAIDVVGSNGNAGALDFASTDIPNTLAAGDFVGPTDQTCLIQLPDELQGVLSQFCAARLLRNGGWKDEAAELRDEAEKMRAEAIELLTPRTPGNPRKLTGGALGQMKRGMGWR
jgi:hypothetical protein